jgi:hypothetical protein
MDLQTNAVLNVFGRGLQDQYSLLYLIEFDSLVFIHVQVRHATLLASVAYLSSAEAAQLSQSTSLLSPMLDTLPPLAQSLSQPPLGFNSSSGSAPRTSNYHYLSTFLSTLTPLCTSHPNLFSPHLVSLLTFLPALILPPVDCDPTPTMGRPFPGNGGISNGRQGAFVFPGVFTIFFLLSIIARSI